MTGSPHIFRSKIVRAWVGTAACVVVLAFSAATLPATFSDPARRMAFIFGLAAVFWAFEILPLHATAILVVLLEVLLLGRWSASGTGIPYERFLAPLASPVIMLFLGGFVLATALRKFGIDQILAGRLITAFGRRPFRVMFGFMSTTAFFALWMSGTATSAMMLAMIGPFWYF